MSAGGLSRRRIAQSANPSEDDDGSPPASVPPTPSGSSTPSHVNGGGFGPGGGGGALAGGSKIAYDPRDLEDAKQEAAEGGRPPRLTIMEEVLLLGLKDKQGYLSFWNDNISYALRGCILAELALRRRIALVRDPGRKRLNLGERLVEVIDERPTGETILDEALKMMAAQPASDRIGVNGWVDLLSGETWNVLKIGYQLKQVRERLAKGLVDKGVLRTEKRNFLLFDMATHPVADVRTKEGIVSRCIALLTTTTSAIPPAALDKEGTQCRAMRAVCLVCAAHAASVLDNAFVRLTYEDREAAFQRCDEILAAFSSWPFGSSAGSKKQRVVIGGGGSISTREAIEGLVGEVRKEMRGGEEDLCFELVAGVLEVLGKLDSIL